MEQVRTIWTGMDMRRQALLVGVGVLLIAGLFALSRFVATPSMALLYAGLEDGIAGEVVQSLDQRNVPYSLRGGSIYVPAKDRDGLRLALAADGLPATGGQGYELLDSLDGFGTTSQMFDAAYWRAKEGELARTIVASPHVSQARVHIARGGSSPFRTQEEAKASVSVVAAGGPLTASQANAIRFLVASAVSGLTVDSVAVIDSRSGVVGTNDAAPAGSIADDRSDVLRERVQRIVEARVGNGNAVVEVSVDTINETETIRELRFDPEGRVAVSTDIEERNDSSTAQAGGVTVASNLPDGDAAGDDASRSVAAESRERINYEVSETEREIVRGAGAVRRLTVAVLVNGVRGIADDGSETFAPRPEEELAALRDLVASAVGFDSERGDVITIRSMELPEAAPVGTAASNSLVDRMSLDLTSLLQVLVLAAVLLVLVFFVVKPVLASPPRALPASLPALDGSPSTADATPTLSGEVTPGRPVASQLQGLPALSRGSETPVERLRAMIGDRQEETVEILRSWLEEDREKAQ